MRHLAAELRRRRPDEREPIVVELVALAGSGDERGWSLLLEHYAERIREVAVRLHLSPAEIPDTAAVGAAAFLDAVRQFDPTRGVPLWGYARKVIRGRMINALARSLGLSARQKSLYRRVWRAYDALLSDPGRGGREPSADEVVSALRSRYGVGVRSETVAVILTRTRRRRRSEGPPVEELAAIPEGDEDEGVGGW